MRINGKPIEREYRTVIIPRKSGNVSIKVGSLPIAFKRKYAELNPRPTPPKRTINQVGKGSREEIDWDNQDFVKAITEWEDLQNYYTIYSVMVDNEGNEFETKSVTCLADLRALKNEFTASGFSEGDCALIMKAALKASNVDEAEVAKASENF